MATERGIIVATLAIHPGDVQSDGEETVESALSVAMSSILRATMTIATVV